MKHENETKQWKTTLKHVMTHSNEKQQSYYNEKTVKHKNEKQQLFNNHTTIV